MTRRTTTLIHQILVAILFYVLSSLLILSLLPSINLKPPSKHSHTTTTIQSQRRVSTINCSSRQKSCLIHNLYYFNKEFHVYLGSHFDWQLHYPDLLDMRILTGIGWGTHLMAFQLNDSSSSSTSVLSTIVPDADANASTNTTLPAWHLLNDNTQLHIIHTHITQPPEHLFPGTAIIIEPTCFFSVLWPNLFRTMYAGVGAWYTLMHYNVFYSKHHRFVLMDNDPKPALFLNLLQHVTPFPVQWHDNIGNSLFRIAVLGISRDVQIAEIDDEVFAEDRFYLRTKVFRMFCEKLKEAALQHSIAIGRPISLSNSWRVLVDCFTFTRKSIRMSLILREGSTRKILNADALEKSLRQIKHVHLTTYRFSKMTLEDQIFVIHQTDILIAMHGAALTHTLYMRPGSYVVELFPYEFHKSIFKNLANIMDVRYQYWQNTHPSDSIQNWTLVATSRFTNLARYKITQLPILWNNMDSKNYWRNQDTRIRLPELNQVLGHLTRSNVENAVKYFIYLPWEQLNNQILGFKSACAIASQLKRTLVIPDIGYRPVNNENSDPNTYIKYKPSDFVWQPFDRYFDSTAMLGLPCNYISMANFITLNAGVSLGKLYYIDLGSGSTFESQLLNYHNHVSRLPHDGIGYNIHHATASASYQHDKHRIMEAYGDMTENVLAVGSMFWHYNFNIVQAYPITRFYDYLAFPADPIYRRICESLMFSERLVLLADAATAVSSFLGHYTAIHLRRGDYSEKCLDGYHAATSCRTPFDIVLKALDGLSVDCYSHLYVATNDMELALRELAPLLALNGGKWGQLVFLDHLLGVAPTDSDDIGGGGGCGDFIDQDKAIDNDTKDVPLYTNVDANDRAILDQIFAIRANSFIGNMHSSFSRHIVEQRVLVDKSSAFFT